MDRYYISPTKNKKIIDGFPSKDEPYINHFFFVALEYAVHDDFLGTVLTRWELWVVVTKVLFVPGVTFMNVLIVYFLVAERTNLIPRTDSRGLHFGLSRIIS